MYFQKPTEITILNSENSEIIKYLNTAFLPESILVTVKNKEQLENLKNFSFFTGKEFSENKTTVFVCKNFTCSLPLESVLEIEKNL